MESSVFLPGCLCPTVPAMSCPSYHLLWRLVLLVRHLHPIFLCREAGVGLDQVTREVAVCRGLCSRRSPKLKSLDPVFVIVLLRAGGWTRGLQRSFLIYILFFSGCCVQHRTVIYQWPHHRRAAWFLSSAVVPRSCPQPLLPCTKSLILCSTRALRSQPDPVFMLSRCIWGCGCSLGESDRWH